MIVVEQGLIVLYMYNVGYFLNTLLNHIQYYVRHKLVITHISKYFHLQDGRIAGCCLERLMRDTGWRQQLSTQSHHIFSSIVLAVHWCSVKRVNITAVMLTLCYTTTYNQHVSKVTRISFNCKYLCNKLL